MNALLFCLYFYVVPNLGLDAELLLQNADHFLLFEVFHLEQGEFLLIHVTLHLNFLDPLVEAVYLISDN